jgi:hypothetical protein
MAQRAALEFIAMMMVVAVGMVLAGAVALVFVDVAGAVVGVAPDGKFLQGEEAEDAAEQDGKDFARRHAAFQRFGQQVEHRGRQQQADGKAHRQAEEAARQAEHDQARGEYAHQAAEQAGEGDLQQEGHRAHGWLGLGRAARMRRSGDHHLSTDAAIIAMPSANATMLHLPSGCGFIAPWLQPFQLPPRT